MDGRRSRKRVNAQGSEALTQMIDLCSGPVLGRTFAKLSKFGAPKRSIPLARQIINSTRKLIGINWRGWRLQQLIDALSACPNLESSPQLLAHGDPTGGTMGQPQFLDDADDGLVGNLLRSRH